MMPIESKLLRRRHNRSLWLGIAAGALTVILAAGLANGVLLWQLHDRLEHSNRGNAEALAASVARTLGRQFERAAQLGIPLAAIPGVDRSLQRTLDLVPGLARITLFDAGQGVLGTAQHAHTEAADLVDTPLIAHGAVQGRIEIATAPATLLHAFVSARHRLIALTLGLGLLGGLAGGLYARRLSRHQNRLRALLEAAPGAHAENAHAPCRTARDPITRLERLAHALHAGTAALRDTFESYTRELLAIDFDDRLRAHIAALPSARAKPPAEARGAAPTLPRPARLSLRTRLTLIVALGFIVLISLLLGAQTVRERLLEQRAADTVISDQRALLNEMLSVEILSINGALQQITPTDLSALLLADDPSKSLPEQAGLDILLLMDRDRQVRAMQGEPSPDPLLDAGTFDQVMAGRARSGLRQTADGRVLLIVASRIGVQGSDYVLVAGRALDPALRRYAERSGSTAHFLNLRGALTRSTDPQLWQAAALSPSTRQASHQSLERDGRLYTVTTIPFADISGGAGGAVSSLKDVTAALAPGRMLERLALIATLAFALLSVLIVYLVIWRSFRPLQDAIDVLQSLSSHSAGTPRRASTHGLDEIESLGAAITAFRRNTSQLSLSQAVRERTRRRQETVIARELQALADAMDEANRDEVLRLLDGANGFAHEKEPLRRLAHVMGELRSRVIDQHQHLSAMVIELREALMSKTKLIELQQELQVARTVQMSILPRIVPTDPRMALHCRIIPAREVGGDFYDYYMLDADHLGFVIADVSGKGVPAALFMAISRTLLKSTALFVDTPGACISRLNELLAAENEQMLFVTLFYGVLDLRSGMLEYVNAGHNPPYLLRHTRTIEHVPSTQGMAVGVAEGITYRQGQLALTPGDTLYLYTDGITEAFDADQQVYGEDRLESVLKSQPVDAELGALSESIIEDVGVFERGVRQTDDITSLCLRYHGPNGPGSAPA